MTDMGITPGDQTINLDLGGVDAIHGWMPVPSGVYALQIADAKVVPTKKGGRQIEFNNRICEGPLANRSIGIDRLYIPNREQQTPEAYETTAGYFKGKIEAITGRPYGGSLNVREMIGMKFKALVILKDDGFGPQNEISTYLPYNTDTTGIVIPAQSAPRPQQNGGGAAAPDQTRSGFRI